MHWIDWLFVIVPLIVVITIALKSQKYVKGARLSLRQYRYSAYTCS